MFAVLMVLWFIFNERVTVELVLIGLAACAAVDLFVWKILGGVRRRRPDTLWRLLKGGAEYALSVMKQIFRSNAAVIRLILSPSLEPEPELHHFRTGLKTDAARVILANSITITPGTITCGLEGDRFIVHALDRTLGQGVEASDFEKRLMTLEAIADESHRGV